MLLIQKINLTWDKNERGAEYEKARRQFAFAYPLEKHQFSTDVAVHSLSFFQEGKIFHNSEQNAHLSLKKHLPQMGFTEKQIQREIQSRVSWIKKHQFESYDSIEMLNLANLSVSRRNGKFEITFFYDEHRSGMPLRRGHNKDFQNQGSPLYGKDILNETAFALAQNQYGRIVWNERRTDFDNGTWYYQLHIYNLFYLLDHTFPIDIFVKRKPDFEYKQFAALY